MDKKEKTPSIRFREFKEPLEIKKLKEVSSYSNGGSFENHVKEKGAYELITLKSINMSGNLVHSGRFIDIETPTLTKGTLVMILSEQSPGLLGMTAQIPLDNFFVLNQRVAEIRPNQNVDSYFLSKVINTNQRYFSSRGAGTKVQNVSKPNVENFEFSLPSLPEQKKIGTFFQNIDQLITLHQKQYDKLVILKKAMLTKMFPREGKTVPEIRFKGFDGEWVEKSLSVLGDFKSNGVDKKVISTDNYVNLLNYMDVYNSRYLDADNCKYLMQVTAKEAQLKENNVLKNDVFFTPSSETPDDIGKVMVVENDLPNTVYSYHLVRFRPKLDVFYANFPNYSFASSYVRKQLIFSAQGVQRFTLSKTAFEELTVLLPSISEQKRISVYFKNLDQQISSHQAQLDKFTNIKKACLSKMFVSHA